ncbi:MAG TPA: hypothetical protein PK413_12215 [Thermoanaerobaculia bacterium]|nr:hypothetical protein [Thermoanaerobaculia bacterium]
MSLFLVAIGWGPTVRWGGESGPRAMLLALGACAFASLVGGVPVALAQASGDPRRAVTAVLGSLALRFFVALAMIVSTLLSGKVAQAPLLIWFVLGYFALLALDALYARSATRARPTSEK